MTICDSIADATAAFATCVETDAGARLQTTCLYPSFEPVSVYVTKRFDRFLVHDGAGAMHSALQHGRDPRVLLSALRVAANRYDLELGKKAAQLQVQCPDADWLTGAILAVANASAMAANAVVDMDIVEGASDDPGLKEEVREVLLERFGKDRLQSDVGRTGRSGRRFKFDFAILRSDRLALVDAVTPHPTSVVYKYTAFAQVDARRHGGAFAVFNRPLAADDSTMLQEVADVLPVAALADHVERELYGYDAERGRRA